MLGAIPTGETMSRSTDCRVEIHGVRFDDVDHAAVVAQIVTDLAEGRGGWVVTPNIDFLRRVSTDPELALLIDRATISILDGAPVQWAGRIAGRPAVQRTPGSSLAVPLAEAAHARGIPVLLLGGRPGAGEEAAARLRAAYPDLDVQHCCPPMGFENDPDEWARVVAAVRGVEGGIVLVGLGFPKQERLSLEMSTHFPNTWFLGLGGTIDFLGGCTRRAPRWVQEVGFEWVFRLAVEPRRLARRYLVEGLPFAARLMAWAVHERMAARRRLSVTAAATPAPVLTGPPTHIDLSRRVVEVAAGDDAVVEFTVTEYLAELGSTAEPVDQVIDLREPADDVIDLSDGARASTSPAPGLRLPRRVPREAAPAWRDARQDSNVQLAPVPSWAGPFLDPNQTR